MFYVEKLNIGSLFCQTVLTQSLQCKWNHVQRTCKVKGDEFLCLSEKFRTEVLPAITVISQMSNDEFRTVAMPLRFGVLGVIDPKLNPNKNYDDSIRICTHC
ncbi:hypothetical protein GJ496_005999 [Pomphorhynchus laevis]|nr:hypothetical protein GJ496_005999 [Pomphorhynchus laevis]